MTQAYVNSQFAKKLEAVNSLDNSGNGNGQEKQSVTRLLLDFIAENPDIRQKFLSYCKEKG